ncbi:Fur family transcriptional regulator [Scatolibacter rhodanostii]|uniref:Fur family transcriptional regulator n=1 Tax=Scatolibacter rhodanostii TaxID=2014781 RepID=UPI000C08A019|nr:Fur family transcriptional regulator [Scatolibacter rhodanostii]
MGQFNGYQTKQGEQLLSYLSSLKGQHVTAEDIIQHFEIAGIRIGRATVYRHLDKLVQSGNVRKYSFENAQSSCYQFVDCQDSCHHHLHLKCKDCGKLFHVESDILSQIEDTFMQSSGFAFDSMSTVFYGICKDCAANHENV